MLLIFNILSFLAEGLILFQYCHSIFSSKYSTKRNIITLAVCCAGMFCVSLLEIPPLNLLTFTLFTFIYIFSIYEIPWFSAFFQTIIVGIFMSLSELIVFSFFPYSAHNYYNNAHQFRDLMLLFVSTKLLFFFSLYYIQRLQLYVKGNQVIRNKGTLLLTITSVFSLWFIITLCAISQYATIDSGLSLMITICAVILFLFTFFVLWIYNDLQTKSQEYLQLQMLRQKENDYTEYQRAILTEDNNQKILIHDIRNHLYAISDLNANEDREAIARYIQHLTASSALQTATRFCDNNLLNSILNRYMKKCQEHHISFKTDIRSKSINYISDEDLTSLFCNLMDNAIDSAKVLPTSYIELNVSYMEQISQTVITLINSCAKDPFSSTGLLNTNKPNAQWHGYGLKSIEHIAEKYCGNLHVYFDEETKTFHTIVTLTGKPQYNP